MASHDPEIRLKRILHGKKIARNEESSLFLSECCQTMEKRKAALQIPDKYIAIIRYLARNPGAIIVPDVNVTQALLHAKRAMT